MVELKTGKEHGKQNCFSMLKNYSCCLSHMLGESCYVTSLELDLIQLIQVGDKTTLVYLHSSLVCAIFKKA